MNDCTTPTPYNCDYCNTLVTDHDLIVPKPDTSFVYMCEECYTDKYGISSAEANELD